jgi:hypothetical protein
MARTRAALEEQPDPEKQLAAFIGKFDDANQRLIRDVRAALRARLPWAHEMVYDNYNFFVIGYSPTLRPSDAILSLAAAAKGVSLCFLQGASLPDPQHIMSGAGKQTRFVRLPSADALKDAALESLIVEAVAFSAAKASGNGTLIIRSVSAKQRPRR